jgi:pyruvate,water dikinase
VDKLYWLDQIQQQDHAKVGNKAFLLSRIIQRGYPVVPGFVVSAEVLHQFWENLRSSESLIADLPHSLLHLDVADWRQLQQVASRLRQEMIGGKLLPESVSTIFQAAKEWQTSCLVFRPTLTVLNHSQGMGNISGLLESVFCPYDEDRITLALKGTWSQLFRARSLLYWQHLGINLGKINFGVLVQPVENAIASGLLNANASVWEIEASWGLGVAITNGEVQPDIYYIQPETGTVIERQLGNKIVAYRVDERPNSNCLLPYILEESQQKQYALPEEFLQQLIVLGNQLVSELGETLTMKWTITEKNSVPQLFLTQVSTPQSVTPNSPLIKGLGASRGRTIANAYVITSPQQKPEQLPNGVILVVPVVTPDWLPLLKQVSGVVTEQGGLTSHAAILSRELSIPAVVGATNATTLIQPGEKLLLDGEQGEVYQIKDDNSRRKEESRESPIPLPIPPPYPIATQLLVNLSQPSLTEQVQSFPVDGVGLLRSELMVLNILEGQHPLNWLSSGRGSELLGRWSEQISQFARAFAPRPIFYRSLDWRPQDLPSLSAVPQSILGERGTLSYIQNGDVFELELKALAVVQASGYTNIHLLLPFVRTVEEFVFCRRQVEQAGLTQVSQFQLWIMAEVPSVLILLPEYIKAGVAGISIGTNDLTQLLLGVDREKGQLAPRLDERHPAVMGAIAQLIKMAKDGGIPCSICGQAPALYPEIIDQLVEWGITSISVEPEALARTYQAIARAEQRLILAAARRQMN